MIYQLAKTTVGLSGQVKWDIVLKGNEVDDLQIVPIHESVNFNYTRRKDTLRYSHVQNLKRLYDKIQSQFFEPIVDPKLTTGYPVRNTGIWLDTHENAYEMGLKRIPYKRYNKQFAFFCPFWVDDMKYLFDEDGELNIRFYIVIENKQGERLARRYIDLSLIKDYLKTYVQEVELDNRLMNISFENRTCWIKGIDVGRGKSMIMDTSRLIDNILDRERPIMEVDNMMLNQFADNNMIASQLFNFNFIFDISDIIPLSLLHYVTGEQVNAYVDMSYMVEKEEKVKEEDSEPSTQVIMVSTKGKKTVRVTIGKDTDTEQEESVVQKEKEKEEIKIELKDIYSNYEFIPRFDMISLEYTRDNCLDYLQDNRCVDLLTKNKLVQSTIHWALRDNPDYMFNLYDGCAPIRNGELCKGLYFDSPDTYTNVYSLQRNPFFWCKNTIMNTDSLYDLIDKVNYIYDHPETACSTPQLRDNNWWYNKTRIQDFKESDGYAGLKDIHDYVGVITVKGNISATVLWNYIERFEDNQWLMGRLGDADRASKTVTYISRSDGENRVLLFLLFSIDKNDACKDISYKHILEGFESYEGYDYLGVEYLPYILKKYLLNDKNTDWENYISDMESIASNIYNILSHIIHPSLCAFTKSVQPVQYDRPANLATDDEKYEIYYVKKDEELSYVLRYDGNIYPYFITPNETLKNNQLMNYTYAVKQYNQSIENADTSNIDIRIFNAYTHTKYQPIYPSLKYFALKRYKSSIYKYFRPSKRYYREISWYKKNLLYILPPVVNITYINTVKQGPITEDKIKRLLKNKLFKSINFEVYGHQEKKKNKMFYNFLWDLYDYKYTYDYLNNSNVKKYVYRIKYTLK